MNGTLKIKLKRNRFICVAFILLMIILAGANTMNNDIESSMIEYNKIFTLRQGEWLNFIIMNVFRYFGLSYEIYRLFLYMLGYYLIFATLSKIFPYSFLVVALYLIYPFTIDFIQTPNFCSMALVVFATRYLCDFNKIRNRVLYIVCVFLAAGMHVVAYLFLPVFFVVYYAKDKRVINYGLIFAIIGLSLGILDWGIRFIPKIASFVFRNDSRLSLYFNNYTRFGFLLYWCIQLLLLLVSLVAYRNSSKTVIDSYEGKQRKEYIKAIYLISGYGCLLMPLVGYAGTLFRVIRNYFILVYAVWAYFISRIQDSRKRLLLRVISLLFPFTLFFLESDTVRQYALDLFKNNWLLP